MVGHGEGLGHWLECGGSHRVGNSGHPLNHFLNINRVTNCVSAQEMEWTHLS